MDRGAHSEFWHAETIHLIASLVEQIRLGPLADVAVGGTRAPSTKMQYSQADSGCMLSGVRPIHPEVVGWSTAPSWARSSCNHYK